MDTYNIKNSTILRILYTDLNMSKLYIQKNDGTNFISYLIAEDRLTYTFRNELYKPEEFTVPRSEIRFIAEKNPSDLKAKAYSKSVELSWVAPNGQVKFYNVYIKKNEQLKDVQKKTKEEIEKYKDQLKKQNHKNILEIRDVIKSYEDIGKIHLGGIPMIADDMMSFIKSDIPIAFLLGSLIRLIVMRDGNLRSSSINKSISKSFI